MLAYIKFRIMRRLRRMGREFRYLKRWLSDFLYRYLRGKWQQLALARRFLLVWWLVIVLAVVGLWHQMRGLAGPTTLPKIGGEYVEGVVGQVKLVNPILPDNSASADISRLIFNGLTRYNPQGKLEADLATSWQVSADAKTYTFKLRPGVKWQDGVPFTARDVLFTVTAIQDPDSRSPLASSWQQVKATAPDRSTVVFQLPSPDPSFIYSTAVGILPSHLLESTDPSLLRFSSYNQHPVGTGPFKLTSFDPAANFLELTANPNYFDGRPYLNTVSFRLFSDTRQVLDAYAKHQILGLSLPPALLAQAHKLPALRFYHASTFNQTYLFLHNSQSVLSDQAVRSALSLAVSRGQILGSVMYGQAIAAPLPLLPTQLGYDDKYNHFPYDLAKAAKTLDDAGWKMGSGGARFKSGHPLELNLVTTQGGDYPGVASLVKKQWAKLGVKTNVILVDSRALQQSYIKPRHFDVLLFGLSLGVDPDVYPYWDSAQANDPGLNVAQYKSDVTDKALASARVVNDEATRAAKYRSFLAAWASDQPSIGLYNPKYLYAVSSRVAGVKLDEIVNPADRFYDIEHWWLK